MRFPLTVLACLVMAPAAAQHAPIARAKASPIEQEARAAVSATMKDPASSQFQNLRTRRVPGRQGEFDAVCGEVNAKNAYGGYVGFAPFIYLGHIKQAHVLGPDRNVATIELLKMYCS